MCGIIGYVGKQKCKSIILEGLSRLEYRGYDSAGFVCIDTKNQRLNFTKEVGPITKLKESLEHNTHDGSIGLGHTRWATHGAANQVNSHPHFDCTNNIAVMHNGIIENYATLRNQLIQEGHVFHSTTDTEVTAHLLEKALQKNNSLKAAILDVLKQLKGVYALFFILEEHPDQLVVIRQKSPLVIGLGEKEMYVASDPLAFIDKTNKVFFLADETFAFIKKDSIELFDFQGAPLNITPQTLNYTLTTSTKQGFEHFLLKEIYEQKKAIDQTISFYKRIGSQVDPISDAPEFKIKTDYDDAIWKQLGLTSQQVKNLKSVNLVAAGTSWHAGRIAQFFFENICNIPAHVHLASEFRYKKFFPEENSVFITISQSGETADTLECLRYVNAHDIPTIALTNVASSTMVREAHGFLLMQAGPEISVASTKAFTSQLVSLFWLANRIALERGTITPIQMNTAEEDVFVAAEVLESSIETYKWEITNTLAPKYSKYDRFIFLGRHLNYPFAMEAALKLKEISYIFAQTYPAGELKHGPIALIDEKTPVVLFSLLDPLLYQKLCSNAQEVKARNGHLIVFAFSGQTELINLADHAFVLPEVNPLLTPVIMSGVMQFFVYRIAKELGLPIDKPRNLAKSVTVE